MYSLHYIWLDIHERAIAFCIKALDGRLIGQGKIVADRKPLGDWIQGLPGPWIGAMEVTLFTGWIYDFLKPHNYDLPAVLCRPGDCACDTALQPLVCFKAGRLTQTQSSAEVIEDMEWY
jgi:hypothetical protein